MTTTETAERNERKTIEGTVVSARAAKTRVIRITRVFRHPAYDKILQKRRKVYAHDEENSSREGDRVEIMSTRPLSKLKRWRVVRVLPLPGAAKAAAK